LISGVIKSQALKNGRAKNFRNFNYLYEPTVRSDKFREMKEKFRIGDGSIDKLSPYIEQDPNANNYSEYNLR
jgi:hypothetical protein